MNYTFPITKEMACARNMINVSYKSTLVVARALNNKPYLKARKIIENLVIEKVPLKGKDTGKYHTKAARELLKMINSLESNAKAKNLPYEKMSLFVSVHKGPSLYRMRTKHMYGKQLKACNVQVVLKGEKIGTGEKVRS